MRRIAIGALIAFSLTLLAVAVTLQHGNNHAGLLRLTPADFVVASSRDAGPGTLREAILAADRSPSRAHILITAKLITIESALPALVNPHGIDIDAAADSGNLDANSTEVALQISSPTSTLRGLHIVNAHASGIVVNAPGVQLLSLSVTDSKIGVLLGTTARGCTIRSSIFERDETALLAESDARDITILSSVFRANRRAGFWFVGAVEKQAADAGSVKRIPTVRERVRIVDDLFEANASGVVVGNRSISVQRSRFIGNKESAVLILGGAAHVEHSEIRGSGGTGIAVISGRYVLIANNVLIDNPSTAIMVRDSDVTIERNTLQHNGFGIVAIVSQDSISPVIEENLVTRSTADAITLIGGAYVLHGNKVIENRGAGLRTLDLVSAGAGLKVAPRLDANVFKGNGIDLPPSAVYRVAGTP